LTAQTPSFGYELWRSDGTTEGTELVRNINLTRSSYPESPANVGGVLFFNADDGRVGEELWALRAASATTTRTVPTTSTCTTTCTLPTTRPCPTSNTAAPTTTPANRSTPTTTGTTTTRLAATTTSSMAVSTTAPVTTSTSTTATPSSTTSTTTVAPEICGNCI